MLTITANRLQSIQRASRALRLFLIFICPFFVLGIYFKTVNPSPGDTRTLAGIVFQGASLTDRVQLLWVVQNVLAAALTLKVVYHCIRLLGSFSKGTLFAAQNVTQLRRAGLTLMFAPAIWLIALIGAAPAIAAAQDQWVNIIPSFPAGALITGGVLVYASQILNEGRELRDEQDLVI